MADVEPTASAILALPALFGWQFMPIDIIEFRQPAILWTHQLVEDEIAHTACFLQHLQVTADCRRGEERLKEVHGWILRLTIFRRVKILGHTPIVTAGLIAEMILQRLPGIKHCLMVFRIAGTAKGMG